MPLLIGAAIRDGRYIVESLLSEEELSNIYVVLDTQEPEKKYSLEELVLLEGEEATSVKEAFIQNAVMQMQREEEPAPEGEVKVYDVFEENDTAYCVKDFPDGFVPEPPVKSTNPRSLSGAVEGAGLVVDAVSSVVKPVVSVGSSIPNVVGGIGAVISGDSEEEKEEKTVEPAEEPLEAPIEASADEHAEDAVAVEEPEEEPTDEPEEAVAEADDVPEGETAEDAVETTAEDEEEVEAVVVPVAEEETEDKTRPISVEINVFINEVHKEKAAQPVQPVAEKKRRSGCLLWTILILLLLTLGAAAYIYFVPFSEKPAQPAPHQTDSTSVGDTLSPHDTLSPRDTIDTPVLSDTLVYVVPTVPTPSDTPTEPNTSGTTNITNITNTTNTSNTTNITNVTNTTNISTTQNSTQKSSSGSTKPTTPAAKQDGKIRIYVECNYQPSIPGLPDFFHSNNINTFINSFKRGLLSRLDTDKKLCESSRSEADKVIVVNLSVKDFKANTNNTYLVRLYADFYMDGKYYTFDEQVTREYGIKGVKFSIHEAFDKALMGILDALPKKFIEDLNK